MNQRVIRYNINVIRKKQRKIAKEVYTNVGEVPAVQKEVTSVVNIVMDVTHWSEGIFEIMVEHVSIEWTESDSKLSDPFLFVPVIDSKHLFAFWENSFQHFIFKVGFKNKVFC